MKKDENKTARRMQTIAICGCLCLLAVGAGVTYRAFDRSAAEPADLWEEEQPVTAVQSPTIDTAVLTRNQKSNDPGESPDGEKTPTKQTESAKPVFAYPVDGEIVMAYSVDHAIYDPTLDQYRTNASISLSAKQGTEVKAAADGVVKEVKTDAEAGNVVVIEHAENWLTTYGQLADTVKVKEGETVKQGQVIGYVDTPTKYGVALGDHLEFAMEQNGESKDPAKNLEKTE